MCCCSCCCVCREIGDCPPTTLQQPHPHKSAGVPSSYVPPQRYQEGTSTRSSLGGNLEERSRKWTLRLWSGRIVVVELWFTAHLDLELLISSLFGWKFGVYCLKTAKEQNWNPQYFFLVWRFGTIGSSLCLELHVFCETTIYMKSLFLEMLSERSLLTLDSLILSFHRF